MTADETRAIADAAAQFPETFGLRAFPGERFRISPRASYMSGEKVVLYTQVRQGEAWVDFAKGTPAEIRAQVTP